MNDPYQVTIGGIKADPYRIARAYELDATLGAALKKLLRCGRKHKDLATDVREAITTLERWEQMNLEDSAHPAQSMELNRLIEKPLPDSDGWIPHTPGNPMPCGPWLTVLVKLRGGSTQGPNKSIDFLWGKARTDQEEHEIIAWKPA